MATVILPAARSCFSSSASAGFPTLLHHFFHPSASFIFVTCNCPEIWQVVKRQWSVQHQIRHQPNVVLLNCFVLVIMTESNIPKIVGYSMMSDQSEATGQYAQLQTSKPSALETAQSYSPQVTIRQHVMHDTKCRRCYSTSPQMQQGRQESSKAVFTSNA